MWQERRILDLLVESSISGKRSCGMIMDDFKVEGKVPVVMERFTIGRIVEDIALDIFFSSTVVGTRSRLQYESDD